MIVPRHWAKAAGSAVDPKGKRFHFDLWGWSGESAAHAREMARRRLADLLARVGRGEMAGAYLYGTHPLREEIVRTLGEENEASETVITRNRYGALVLNTARVPFIDVDAPAESGLARFFKRLLRRDGGPDATLAAVRAACARQASQSFRIYQTRAGYRVLATSLLLDPRSDAAQALLTSFGADPYFARLCKLQGCFRARLSPKPWRVGCALPPGRHPREDAAVQRAFASWEAAYRAASEGFASCRFVESIGSARTTPESRAVVEEHDRVALAQSDLPLA